MAVHTATADSVDIAELAGVAARTFSLACPPSVTPANVASFVDANLSDVRFAEYLADPQRLILTASHDDRIVGYAMLIAASATIPTCSGRCPLDRRRNCRRCMCCRHHHGSGVATVLMDAALVAATDWGAECVWLGVNQENQRAQRFYEKCGFTVNGTRTFQLGTHTENDYVMVRLEH